MGRRGSRLASLLTAALLAAVAWSPIGWAAEPQWVWDDVAQRFLRTPAGYVVDRVLTVRTDQGGLKGPQDLFFDATGHLWVVDSDNHRVLKMTREGEVKAILPAPGSGRLQRPQGVFVDDDGTVYVADTGNGRVVAFGPDGQWLRTYEAPASSLLDRSFTFKPSKLLVDNRGYLNIVNEGEYRGIVLLDLDGDFRGFFAPNPVGFDWRRLLIRLLATEAQRERIARLLPPPHSNVTQDSQGFIYTTTVHAQRGQIKRFNSIGRNTYPDKAYGHTWYRDLQQVLPHFTDLAVDETGIVTAVDAASQLVYQYDQEGNNLLIFGGRGEREGGFLYPSAIEVDERGWLYIADREQNVIQVFRPTEFMRLVHQASFLYYDGRYEEAGEPWRQVLQLDANYLIAHRGLGRALLKQGQLREAMEAFRLGKDRAGYSRAFAELRYRWMRANFGWTVVIVAGVLTGAWMAVRLAARIMEAARRHYGGYV